jgi:hypothetical protein
MNSDWRKPVHSTEEDKAYQEKKKSLKVEHKAQKKEVGLINRSADYQPQ